MPRTPTKRAAIAFVTLLYEVAKNAQTGFDFHGKHYRPGAWLDYEDFWPTPQYPITPLVLEHTQVDFSGRGHNRNPTLHVLWQWDESEASKWREVASHHGLGLNWVSHLAPLARNLLKNTAPPVAYKIQPSIRRIIDAVERELLKAPSEQTRYELLQTVYEYFSGELVREPGEQMPLDWKAHFGLRPED